MPAERPSSSVNIFVSAESGAKMFGYGSNGAAGVDIFSYSCKAEIPVGYYGDIRSTSALALEGIDIGAGVVDSDYRRYIGVIVINNSKSDFIIIPHQKIAQMIVSPWPYAHVNIFYRKELTPTVRGANGFSLYNE